MLLSTFDIIFDEATNLSISYTKHTILSSFITVAVDNYHNHMVLVLVAVDGILGNLVRLVDIDLVALVDNLVDDNHVDHIVRDHFVVHMVDLVVVDMIVNQVVVVDKHRPVVLDWMTYLVVVAIVAVVVTVVVAVVVVVVHNLMEEVVVHQLMMVEKNMVVENLAMHRLLVVEHMAMVVDCLVHSEHYVVLMAVHFLHHSQYHHLNLDLPLDWDLVNCYMMQH